MSGRGGEKNEFLLVAEIDYDPSSHNWRKTEMRIGTFWRQTYRQWCLYGAALRLLKTLLMKMYNVMIPGGPGQAGSLLLQGHGNWCVIKLKLLQENKRCRSVIADDARAFSLPGSTWRGCYSKETTADWRDLKLKECTSVTEGPLSFYETLLQLYLCAQWRTKGRLGGGSTPPTEIPKFWQSRTGLQIEPKMFSVSIPAS